MFIDLHCHILPKLDDGAESMAEACELIRLACDAGTKIMAATPHYNNSLQCSSLLTKEAIMDSFRGLKTALQNENIPVSVYLGSEFLADNKTEHICNKDSIIPINGTRYVLTEFYFDEQMKNIFRYVDILLSAGYIPIIAHPERYSFFADDKNAIYALLEKGCKIQINKGSPSGRYGVSPMQMSEWLLFNDFVHLIASDCHNSSSRNADMGEIYPYLLDKFSVEKITRLMHDNPKRILLDADI